MHVTKARDHGMSLKVIVLALKTVYQKRFASSFLL